MVLSKINNKVSYKETKTVDEEDVGHASPIYSMPIFNTDVAIVLGKPKYQFASTKEVVYYPIYLLSKNKIPSHICLTHSEHSCTGMEYNIPIIFLIKLVNPYDIPIQIHFLKDMVLIVYPYHANPIQIHHQSKQNNVRLIYPKLL